jgi:class 3 adenylate cyclase/predicted ATPase
MTVNHKGDKMKCPTCRFSNPSGAKFCNECGGLLEIACPACDLSNPPGSKFCSGCGKGLKPDIKASVNHLSLNDKLRKIQQYLPKSLADKILSQKDRIEGERKVVTIMFCDMKEFTPLTENIGPEKTFTLMDQVFEILIHRVHDYGGMVNELRGDGILAFYGVPIALEDAPQRAIRSALAIHREMIRFNEKIKAGDKLPQILLRIGINTGPVVVGTVGNDLRVKFTAVGDTINMASRVENMAEPGTTYVTEETFKLTEGLFRFEALGKKEIKGKNEPINIYRVISTSSRRTQFDVNAEKGLTPLSGREREIELLLDCLERVKAGRGQSFSIISDAGLGKSRLLYEFRKAVANEELTFLEGRCFSYSRKVAYHPIIDILKSNFDIQESDDDETVIEKVQQFINLYAPEESSVVPFIVELLSVQESGIGGYSLNAKDLKSRIFGALKKIILIGAGMRPLVIAIEDLHWIDETSHEFIRYVMEWISGYRILFIFTFRPEFVPAWKIKSYHNQANLNRLSNRESLAMAADLLKTNELAKNLEDIILEKTEGVPFYVEEFIRTLIDMKLVVRNDKCYLSKDLHGLVIPSTIQDVIMARVDSLPARAKQLLLIGSVIGREFDYELIQAVTNLPENELLSLLAVLNNSEHIYERIMHAKVTYVFSHTLIQDVANQSLLLDKRKKYHQRIAIVMEQHFTDIVNAKPEVAAFHFEEAGLKKKAIEYLQKAAEIASRRSANSEAANHLNRALRMLGSGANYTDSEQKEFELLLGLGPALMATKGYAAKEVERTFARAKELCLKQGKTTHLFDVQRGLWGYFVVLGDLRTALNQGEECSHLAQNNKNPALLIWSHYMMGMTLFHLGKLEAAIDYLDRGIALYDAKKRRDQRALQDPGVACQSYRAPSLWLLGYPDQAFEASREALELAKRLKHPFSLMYALYMTAAVCQLLNNVPETQERAEEADLLCDKYGGQPFWKAWGLVLRGWALSEKGMQAEGIAESRKGLSVTQTTGSLLANPYLYSIQVEIYRKAGKIREGLTVLADTFKMVEKTRERFWEAEMHRIKGELMLTVSMDHKLKAEASFHKALKIARHQRAQSLELRAAMSLSRIWLKTGRKGEARTIITRMVNRFKEGWDTQDLKLAGKMAEKLNRDSERIPRGLPRG